MLRTCMGTEGLIDVFVRLGKTPTKENAHTLCSMACAAPEIFLAPAMGPLKCHMVADLVCMWAKLNDIPVYSPYAELARKVIGQYSTDDFKSADTLKAIFDALDEKVAQIRKLLQDDGFPDIT